MAKIPSLQTDGSAGYDLYACLDTPLTIAPGTTEKIPTGIAIAIPSPHYAAFIYARSSLGIHHGIVPANCVGVIDSDYRGEILVGLFNHSAQPYIVEPNERIAQVVFAPVFRPILKVVDTLDTTTRGDGGFGSTGRGNLT